MTSLAKDVLRGYDDNCSVLATIFFSLENIDLIQKKIILDTFHQTKVKIPYQSEERLLIAMKHVYDNEAKNLPCDYTNQIRELDNKVVTTVMPDIITAIEQNRAYLDIVAGKRPLLEPPINASRRAATNITELPGDRQRPSECCTYPT